MSRAAAYPRTLPALYGRVFEKYADRTALRDPAAELTYREADARSAALANALVEAGVGVGDRVGVLLANSVHVPVADAAVARAGGARLPLSPAYGRAELRQRVADGGATALLCDAAHAEDALALAGDVESVTGVLVRDDGDGDDLPAGVAPWPDPGAATGVDAATDPDVGMAPPAVHPAPDDLAGLYYTGGTTGRPKGVRYTHRALVANLLAHPPELGFHGGDVGLVTTPMAHSAGTFAWATLLCGGTVVVRDGFDADRVLATVEREAVTWTFAVPTMVSRLLDADGLDDADLSSLERLVYGAAPIRPALLREGVERLGPVFVQFYGQTEVPNLVTTFGREEHARAVEEGDDDRLRSAGTPCLRAELRLVDPDTGADAGDGPGEVVVAAPYAFDGYHDRPEATDETLRDGWVHTGDVGALDEEGYLTLLDRTEDVVVTGGLNVYSQEVEAVLADHPGVEAAAVVGVPDEEWGEAVHAVVVPAPGASPTAEELRALVGERLAPYKRPKTVAFADALPTTSLGKLDRERVRERHWDGEDRSI